MSEPRPAVLLLDVMDTLVYEPFYVEIPAFFGMSFEELLEAKHPTAWAEFESGTIDEETLLAKFFRDGRDFDHQGLKDCMRDAFRWVEGMEELVAELAGAGHELHALSNYAPWYAMIEERLRLSRFLSWSFVSCDMGVRKPHPEAFRGPVRALGVAPERCLFVDDREGNCRAARREGLEAIHFQGAGALRSELEGRALLPG